ncbi:MAG: thioredoxin family protein [Bacilli bacterium]|nr:thioredoxin family protein [Bacilli bacterium]
MNKEKIKNTFKNNYWLQPVLLVALVFVLVFGLQLVPKWVNNWKTNHTDSTTCEKCTTQTLDKINERIDNNETFYVLITQKTCSNCLKAYPIFNKLMSSYPNLTIYSIDIEYDSTNEEYLDTTITDEKIYNFGKLIDVAITSAGEASNYNATTDEYNIGTPTVIQFTKGSPDNALVGIADYAELADFLGVAD